MTMTEPGVGTRRRAEADPIGTEPAPRLGISELVDIVRAVAAEPERWRPRVHHQIARRYYERLVTADDHEVWLICWDVGQMTLLHDHGSSAGAYQVVEGSLLEDHGRAGSGRLLQRRIPRGRARSFGPGYVHNLANAGPGLATSIHAYTPAADDDDVLRRPAGRGRPHPLPPRAVARAGGAPSDGRRAVRAGGQPHPPPEPGRDRRGRPPGGAPGRPAADRLPLAGGRGLGRHPGAPARARVAARPSRRLPPRRALGARARGRLDVLRGLRAPRSRPTCCSTSWA